jgi:hypothetical protein
MSLYLSLPILFIKFWFIDAPLSFIKFFLSVNHAALQILSLPLLIRTFFKPLKNEYRKGLVGFSIVFGIILKSALIFADLVMLAFILVIEAGIILAFVAWPFLTFYILTI